MNKLSGSSKIDSSLAALLFLSDALGFGFIENMSSSNISTSFVAKSSTSEIGFFTAVDPFPAARAAPPNTSSSSSSSSGGGGGGDRSMLRSNIDAGGLGLLVVSDAFVDVVDVVDGGGGVGLLVSVGLTVSTGLAVSVFSTGKVLAAGLVLLDGLELNMSSSSSSEPNKSSFSIKKI